MCDQWIKGLVGYGLWWNHGPPVVALVFLVNTIFHIQRRNKYVGSWSCQLVTSLRNLKKPCPITFEHKLTRKPKCLTQMVGDRTDQDT